MYQENMLAGKIAIVTGAASGIGLAIARFFTGNGCRVFALDKRSLEEAKLGAYRDAFAERYDTVDVSNSHDVQRYVKSLAETGVPVNILVNNAGITHKRKAITRVEEWEYEEVFGVNLKGVFLLTCSLLNLKVLSPPASIINISSTAAFRPRSGLAIYNASKGALESLTKSMAIEFATQNIRVNALCPVLTDGTGLTSAFVGENRLIQEFVESIPLGRLCHPDDVAKAAAFFASEMSSFITGTSLPVDGGRSI